MPAIIRMLRPLDWTKNLVVFIALVFARKLGDGEVVVAAVVAFAAFCLMASGFYAINDALDAPRDRHHPMKKRRPVASGAVSRSTALGLGGALVVVGAGITLPVGLPLLWCALAYVLLQVLYNLALKRILTVDVVAIAVGFVIRAAAGAAAISVPISVWLVLCVLFLCLFLALIKRLADVCSVGDQSATPWRGHADYDSRPELHWMLAVTGTLAVVSYLTYSLSPHAERLFGPRAIGLALLTPLPVMVMHRMFRRANLGRSDRPIDALREDPTVLLSFLLFVAGAIAALYAPGLDDVLASLMQR